MDSESEVRERILRAATDLFSQYGFQAVGVGRLVEEAGVAKMTLYRYFDSKDALIEAYLAVEDSLFWAWFHRSTEGLVNPKAKLRAFFDALGRRTADAACTGCPFQIAAVEFPHPDHPAHRQARANKKRVCDELMKWVRGAGLKNVEKTAHQLYVVAEGAWATARLPLESRSTPDLGRAAALIVEGELYAEAVGVSTVSTKSDRW